MTHSFGRLLGDRRPFIAALIVPERRHIAAALDRMETALSDRDVQAALKQRVDMINTQLDRYGKIRKIAVISGRLPRGASQPYVYSGGSQESEASSMEFS